MIRRILCAECAKDLRPLDPQDVADGWVSRTVDIIAKKPTIHHITINGVAQEEFATLICDGCGSAIPDGASAATWTMYRPLRESEPENWEQEYQQL